MIIICLVRSHRLSLLQDAIAQHNNCNPPRAWGLFELERLDIAGIPVSRIALLCDQMPPSEFEIPIEGIINEGRYCPECFKMGKFKTLPPQNKSGFCAVHQDKNPLRKARKRN